MTSSAARGTISARREFCCLEVLCQSLQGGYSGFPHWLAGRTNLKAQLCLIIVKVQRPHLRWKWLPELFQGQV